MNKLTANKCHKCGYEMPLRETFNWRSKDWCARCYIDKRTPELDKRFAEAVIKRYELN